MGQEKAKIREYVTEIHQALFSKIKMNKRQVEKLAAKFGILNQNYVKEITEYAIVTAVRMQIDVCKEKFNDSEKEIYDTIVDIYKTQVNLSHRTSYSMMLQQYSTPAPISYLASSYIYSGNDKKYFEPSAGNGLMTVALPYSVTDVNEIDEIRLSNLNVQYFNKVTNQDASKPFKGREKYYNGVVTNPPFGTLLEYQEFDGYKIKTLDHAMAIHALNTMKDSGKAAIIIGGHTKWDSLGRIQAGKNRIFFNYLYKHYNVEDVILIDGHKLYSRQGTAFDVRLILINGRKTKSEGAAPLKNDMLATIIKDFDELFNRIYGVSEKIDAEFEKFKNKDKIKLKLKLQKQKLELLEIQFAGFDISGALLRLNQKFNEQYNKYKKKVLGKPYIEVGKTGEISGILVNNGIIDNLIIIKTKDLRIKEKRHKLTESQILNLPLKLSNPLMITDYIDVNGQKSKNIFIPEINHEGIMLVGLYQDVKYRKLIINRIATIHGRNENQLIRFAKEKTTFIDYEKIKEFFRDRSINRSKYEKFLKYLEQIYGK